MFLTHLKLNLMSAFALYQESLGITAVARVGQIRTRRKMQHAHTIQSDCVEHVSQIASYARHIVEQSTRIIKSTIPGMGHTPCGIRHAACGELCAER